MRFIVDTGAEFSIINPNLCNPKWKTITPPEELKTLKHTVSSNIKCKFPLFPIFKEDNLYVEFLELDFHNKFDGLIGNNILVQLNATIDYKNRVIETRNSVIPFFLNKEEEEYCSNSYKDNYIELFANEVNNFNVLDHVEMSHLNYEEKTLVKKVILNNKSVFYKENDDLTFTNKTKHSIVTKNDIPIYSKLYRYPEVHKNEVNTQIEEMLKSKIIQHSNSPYNSPIWIVPKKLDNSGRQKWRIVIDYRKLNDVTIDDKFPIPNLEDIFEKLGNANYFTTLDLAKGFHQIEVDPKDRQKTAFSTSTGHYEFLRMPFGLKNAPSTFQRLMNQVLKDYINKICIVYMDDILIFSTSLKEHIDSIQKIFAALSKVNLKIQIDKCSFLKHETEFLGHIVTDKGLKPNPKKIESILKIQLPKTQKEIKSFLGVSGYYRKFIKDYAKIAYPLTKCLKKGAKINSLDKNYQESFNKLKTLLTTDPILKYPDFDKHFTLTTDASNVALGAVLSQNDHPISFISRTLNVHEKNYSTIEKELLAIVWATKHFRPYLYGRKFTIKTDHRPLIWINNLKEPNSKLQRWKIKLNEFNFDIEYLKGKQNYVADCLSRIEQNRNGNNQSIDSEINLSNFFSENTCKLILNSENDEISSNNATVHSAQEDASDLIFITERPINIFKHQIYLISGNTESVVTTTIHKKQQNTVCVTENSNLLDIMKKILVDKGTVCIHCDDNTLFLKFQDLYKKYFSQNRNLKVLKSPKSLVNITDKNEIITLIKEEHLRNNHRGINEIYLELKNKYFYPNLCVEINKFINNCEVCNLAKHDRRPPKIPFNVTETPHSFNNIVHIDIWFPERNKPFLTTIDKFSKYATIHKLSDRNWIAILAALKERIQTLGKMKKLISDGERCIIHNAVEQFLTEHEIDFHQTTGWHKTGNSDIERLHGTLNEHLRIMNVDKQNNVELDDRIFKIITSYNNTIHSVTKLRPIDFITKDFDRKEIQELRNKFEAEKKKRIREH